MCARFLYECGECHTHMETEEEKQQRLRRIEADRLRRQRWMLHEYIKV